jgi:hypothetical protein
MVVEAEQVAVQNENKASAFFIAEPPSLGDPQPFGCIAHYPKHVFEGYVNLFFPSPA